LGYDVFNVGYLLVIASTKINSKNFIVLFVSPPEPKKKKKNHLFSIMHEENVIISYGKREADVWLLIINLLVNLIYDL
jgi:hypothetical protein